jgi:hypothetical protein
VLGELPDKIAIAVDTQMDDSQPATGTVRGLLQGGAPNPPLLRVPRRRPTRSATRKPAQPLRPLQGDLI